MSAIAALLRRVGVIESSLLDLQASIPFAGRRAVVNLDRNGNGMDLVHDFVAATPVAIPHNLGRTPVRWFASGAAVGQQVPKITVTAVSSTSITIQTDVTSTGVIVFIE